ncbi:hypothetical protein EDD18DRAFT_245136 [Armillaria luteobubalina]|uniref:Uncharacterized protein n=1 Tax=Armillaria luteobubalina TaxID=153913 RepID=A0AA39Q3E8_9AGAR|nr:hypothetical protein EDD18DRAFT_245136 [Armillaria luteobubalina]
MLTVLFAVNDGSIKGTAASSQSAVVVGYKILDLFNVFVTMVLICPTQLRYDNPNDHHRDHPNDVCQPHIQARHQHNRRARHGIRQYWDCVRVFIVDSASINLISFRSQETQLVGSDGDEAPKTDGGAPTQETLPSGSHAGLPTAYVYETQEVPILAVDGTTYPSRMMIRSPSSTVYYGVESTSTPNISYVSSSCASTCNLSASNAILSAALSSVLTVLLIAVYNWHPLVSEKKLRTGKK